MLGCPIGNRHESHTRHRCSKLQGDSSARRAGSDHSDADRVPRGLKLLQCGINAHGQLRFSLASCVQPMDELSKLSLATSSSRRPLPLAFHTSQGAAPPPYKVSKCCLSLNVSMPAQKPSYR